jgi:hypothetical protein
VKGAYLGVKAGYSHGVFRNIANALFTYEPFYEETRRIRETQGCTSTYKTFQASNIMSSTQSKPLANSNTEASTINNQFPVPAIHLPQSAMNRNEGNISINTRRCSM